MTSRYSATSASDMLMCSLATISRNCSKVGRLTVPMLVPAGDGERLGGERRSGTSAARCALTEIAEDGRPAAGTCEAECAGRCAYATSRGRDTAPRVLRT